jgi:hypothetical protein
VALSPKRRGAMWFRPSGYVIGALLAGAISAAGLSGLRPRVMPLVVLWLVVDLLAGTLARSARVLARRSRLAAAGDRYWRLIAIGLCCVAAGAGLASLLSGQARLVALLAFLLCTLAALATNRRTTRTMVAAVTTVQVLAAWTSAFLLLGGEGEFGPTLAVLAGAGTFSRLSHAIEPRAWSRWAARLCWAGLLVALVMARQPLLAGLVALTACADDLYRLQPLRRGDAGVLAAVSWVGAWVLVAIASTYWTAPV